MHDLTSFTLIHVPCLQLSSINFLIIFDRFQNNPSSHGVVVLVALPNPSTNEATGISKNCN